MSNICGQTLKRPLLMADLSIAEILFSLHYFSGRSFAAPVACGDFERNGYWVQNGSLKPDLPRKRKFLSPFAKALSARTLKYWQNDFLLVRLLRRRMNARKRRIWTSALMYSKH